jgi:nucleotide-binding universal stress UspA family protein
MANQPNVILVTTDGSEHSLHVLPHAEAFATARDARTLLVEIVEASQQDAATGDGVLNASLRDGESVPEGIVRVATEQGAEMIAMDTRGHGAIHHAVQGSTALDVLLKTALPVLLTGAALADGVPSSVPYRIIVTSDGSPASEDVIRALAPLLTPGRFAVTLLRIHEREADAADEASHMAEYEAQLNSLRPLFPAGLDVQIKVREIALMGGVDTAIIEEAQSWGAGAIAMSTHGVGAARHVFAGSTALLLLGRSPLPVIMARGDQ